MPGRFQHLLNLNLPFKIGPIWSFGGIGDREVNDALHSCEACGFKQDTGVLHRSAMGEVLLPFVVPHPVGIVQNFRSLKRCYKSVHVRKIEAVDLNLSVKRIVSPYRIGQRSDVNILLEQMVSNPSARIAKGPSYDMKGLAHARRSACQAINDAASQKARSIDNSSDGYWCRGIDFCRDPFFITLEILIEHRGQLVCRCVVGCTIVPRGARLQDIGGNARAFGWYFETKASIGDEFHIVQISVKGRVEHGSGVLDLHSVTLAVSATGPTRIDEPSG